MYFLNFYYALGLLFLSEISSTMTHSHRMGHLPQNHSLKDFDDVSGNFVSSHYWSLHRLNQEKFQNVCAAVPACAE